MKDLIIGKMFDTNELNRLQRCAKNKDKKEIIKWAQDFEARLSELYHQRYKEYYLEEYKERLKKLIRHYYSLCILEKILILIMIN